MLKYSCKPYMKFRFFTRKIVFYGWSEAKRAINIWHTAQQFFFFFNMSTKSISGFNHKIVIMSELYIKNPREN